jgi:hypothetical protein
MNYIPDNTQRCKHANVTLCQCFTDDGRFTAYQCDDCGWVTNQDAPADAILNGTDLPLVDERMWEAAIDDNLRRLLKLDDTQKLHGGVAFFARALYRGK